MIALAALGCLTTGIHADDAVLRRTFDTLLPQMGGEQAQQKWQEICWSAAAPGHEADRVLLCKLMAGKLGPGTSAATRVWLLKQLERIGRDECVDALAATASDGDRLVRDAAIRALANNPASAAGDRLRDAYKDAGDDTSRVALANALGFRAEPASVNLLARWDDSSAKAPAVLSAAVRALGKIGTPEAVAALKSALAQAQGPVRLEVSDALAKCAARLITQGKTEEARSIAQILYQPGEPARLAGLEALLRASGDATAATILKVLAGGDSLETTVAVGFAGGLNSPAIKQLAGGLSALPPRAQVGLLGALGARRDRSALEAVVAATTSDKPEVKKAALAALSGVGDRSTVPLLLKAIQDGGEPAQSARHSLETVFAEGVDQALVGSMKQTADRGRRAQLIEILDARRAVLAAPALLEEVASDDGNVRRRAITALGNIAGPENLPGMILGLLKIRDAGERDEAGRAIAEVSTRVADEARRADPVLAVYEKTPAAEQAMLLPVLGRIGGPAALALVRRALADNDQARRSAAQEALFHWPDSTGAEDLVRLAEQSSDQEVKARAVRELARVAVVPGSLGDDAKLGFLKRGMEQAARPEEKRLILDRAREIANFAAVRFVAAEMANPKLRSQAIATVVDLLHHDEIRQAHPAECDKILDEVIKLSKDKSLVERAKSFKSTR
jgi:HEAT repeat protein